MGVSAVYDGNNKVIYLMSNNSAAHNPQISIIKYISSLSSWLHTTDYFLMLDPSTGQHNASGFHLEFSPWDDNNLVAMGIFQNRLL